MDEYQVFIAELLHRVGLEVRFVEPTASPRSLASLGIDSLGALVALDWLLGAEEEPPESLTVDWLFDRWQQTQPHRQVNGLFDADRWET